MPRVLMENTKKAAQLVVATLSKFNNTRGIPMKKITDYLRKEYAFNEINMKMVIRKAIDRGVAFGAIKKINGKFALGDVLHYVRNIKADTSRTRSKESERKTRRGRRRKFKC